MNKLKSRKLWVTVIAAALISFGTQLGFDAETVRSLVYTAMAYVLGQGIADNGAQGVKHS